MEVYTTSPEKHKKFCRLYSVFDKGGSVGNAKGWEASSPPTNFNIMTS